MDTSIALFQSLSSRLCHDLISAFSPLQLGIEALEDQITDRQSYDFLTYSLQKFSIKAKVLKIIFAHPEELNKSLKLLEELAALFQIQCILLIDNDCKQDPMRSQFFSLLTFLSIETLPRGGKLTIASDGNIFKIKAEGRIILNPELQQLIDTQKIDSLNARTVVYQWILMHMNQIQYHLNFTSTPACLELHASPQITE